MTTEWAMTEDGWRILEITDDPPDVTMREPTPEELMDHLYEVAVLGRRGVERARDD